MEKRNPYYDIDRVLRNINRRLESYQKYAGFTDKISGDTNAQLSEHRKFETYLYKALKYSIPGVDLTKYARRTKTGTLYISRSKEALKALDVISTKLEKSMTQFKSVGTMLSDVKKAEMSKGYKPTMQETIEIMQMQSVIESNLTALLEKLYTSDDAESQYILSKVRGKPKGGNKTGKLSVSEYNEIIEMIRKRI